MIFIYGAPSSLHRGNLLNTHIWTNHPPSHPYLHQEFNTPQRSNFMLACGKPSLTTLDSNYNGTVPSPLPTSNVQILIYMFK